MLCVVCWLMVLPAVWWVVVRLLLSAVWCVLRVVCSLLFVVRCVLSVVCCLSVVGGWLLLNGVVWCLLCVG